ncbi:MAG: tRNA (adenosine(37)-N6)-threonylcarbamoyltransferase complex transferase subunit TsaD [bacterium]|nr:tRNA (adenosine(37)-N6)-threonylcarbamoyltransferase complex transferase subunit TsaD [bacterium]
MKVLGIETSADETAVAVLDIKNSSVKVLSNTISSQVKLHTKYGGIVPNLAAREHVKNIRHVFELALKGTGPSRLNLDGIDLIAVTRGPGLGPALLVGITFAKTLAWKYDKPLVGVNHLEGHIYSNWLPPIANPKSKNLNPKQVQNPKFKIQNKKTFPILNLIVSGGHTELVLMEGYGKYKIIGETLDDAVGEAFDKVARLLGLGYPGGPAVAQRATEFKVTTRERSSRRMTESLKLKALEFEFPRPMEHSKNYNFSYSGLKTAVLYKIKDLEKAGVKLKSDVINKICYEFQKAAIDVLIKKTIKAAKEYEVRSIFLSGGVSANKYLRTNLEKEVKNINLNYSQPEFEYTGDNAAMIALAGYFNYKKGPALSKKGGASWKSVEMDSNLGF